LGSELFCFTELYEGTKSSKASYLLVLTWQSRGSLSLHSLNYYSTVAKPHLIEVGIEWALVAYRLYPNG